jgi:hypothetical protein
LLLGREAHQHLLNHQLSLRLPLFCCLRMVTLGGRLLQLLLLLGVQLGFAGRRGSSVLVSLAISGSSADSMQDLSSWGRLARCR